MGAEVCVASCIFGLDVNPVRELSVVFYCDADVKKIKSIAFTLLASKIKDWIVLWQSWNNDE